MNSKDENLLGYLLNALDDEESGQVECLLHDQPETRERLELLRKALAPLALDRTPDEPPVGLARATLARIVRSAPALPHSPVVGHWWRRADVLSAACLLLALGLLLPPGISHLRSVQNRTACQNNMRMFYSALKNYSDRHNEEFPNVATAAPAPRNVAGTFVAILNDEGLLESGISTRCPSNGFQSPSRLSLSELKAMASDDFDAHARSLAGCYAYSLGYSTTDGAVSYWYPKKMDVSFLPILADRPPLQIDQGDPGNSPNHAERGQNVLFMDGHCEFSTNRSFLLPKDDDIYLNFGKKVGTGGLMGDVVLGASTARPVETETPSKTTAR